MLPVDFSIPNTNLPSPTSAWGIAIFVDSD
jgi:hypothetical protein